MKKTCFCWLLTAALCLPLTSCQKGVWDNSEDTVISEDGVAVRFNVSRLEQLPFETATSTRGTDVKAACSKISLAVYQGTTKISQVNQQSTDSNYGQFTMVLAPGDYKIVVIAHNGLKNPTMTDMEKITFDGKVTDTFYYYSDVTVGGSASYDLALKRAVAMFRMVVTDSIPKKVTQMYFYYTGGSSTFDAVHGVGSVNSRQGELRSVTYDDQGKLQPFELYTFPRSDSHELNMTVTAMDASSNTILEKSFPNVDILLNRITQYTGAFFTTSTGGGTTTPGNIGFSVFSEDEWTLVTNTF